MAEVGRFIARLILKDEDPSVVKNEIALFLEDYPLSNLHFSLDHHYYTPAGIRLLDEVTA